MQPIDMDKYEIALLHRPYGVDDELMVPHGDSWELCSVVSETRRDVGGVWMLFRRERAAPRPEREPEYEIDVPAHP